MRVLSGSSAWGAAIVVVSLGLLLPPAAAAQDRQLFEVSAGYQLIGIKGEVDETLGKGWYADLSGNVGRFFAAVFEVGGSYKSLRETVTDQGMTLTAQADLKMHQFMGGVRVKGPSGPVTPFAQFLVGGAHLSASGSASLDGLSFDVSDSSTDFVTQLGGGVTFQLSKRVGLRAAADYVRIFEENEGLNAFRFVVGAAFPF